MTNLRDFLMARYDDEEIRARACQDWSECDPSYGCAAHPRLAWVLADLSAKRQITSAFWAGIESPDPQSSDPSGTERLWALRVMATVYSDHPDFREEWRA